jgi:hypothetical protein
VARTATAGGPRHVPARHVPAALVALVVALVASGPEAAAGPAVVASMAVIAADVASAEARP